MQMSNKDQTLEDYDLQEDSKSKHNQTNQDNKYPQDK